jgi:hypothetical protein
VIPLAAVLPLWRAGRELLKSRLLGLCVCSGIHFALLCLLLYRYGYVSQRHTLVLVSLLIVPAGAALAALWSGRGFRRVAPRCVPIGCLVILGVYAARIPNGDQGYARTLGEWLAAHDPEHSAHVLMGGSSQRRIAFYGDTGFQAWPENAPDADARGQVLVDYLDGQNPDYFAIDVGRGEEIAGNDVLLHEASSSTRLWRGSEIREACNDRGICAHLLARNASVAGSGSPP